MKMLHFVFFFLESTFLCTLMGWAVFESMIPSRPGYIKEETELRFKIDGGQNELLGSLDSFTVFYATKDNPKQWTDPKLRFSHKIDDSVVGKWYVHKLSAGVKQFRLEFNPKKGSEIGRQWPDISTIFLGERVVRKDEINKYFYEPGQKASYDVYLKDYTKGGALWIVIAGATLLDVLMLFGVIFVLRKDRADGFSRVPIA